MSESSYHTHLLDVLAFGEASPDLRLILSPAPAYAYATLSRCWGPKSNRKVMPCFKQPNHKYSISSLRADFVAKVVSDFSQRRYHLLAPWNPLSLV